MKVRKAVGAIVFNDSGDYLLVHKVKNSTDSIEVNGQWDFSKGGVEKEDLNYENAILRELTEETGSNKYEIIKRYEEKIEFNFPESHDYDCQITVMFLVKYLGNGDDLSSNDDEIDSVKIFTKREVIELIKLSETRDFLEKVKW